LKPVRKYPRISCNLPASIVFPEGNLLPIKSTATQLGQGGCLLQTKDLFGTNRPFMLELEIRNAVVRLVARVLYEYAFSDSTYVGVEFINSEDAPVVLMDYIESMITENAIWKVEHN